MVCRWVLGDVCESSSTTDDLTRIDTEGRGEKVRGRREEIMVVTAREGGVRPRTSYIAPGQRRDWTVTPETCVSAVTFAFLLSRFRTRATERERAGIPRRFAYRRCGVAAQRQPVLVRATNRNPQARLSSSAVFGMSRHGAAMGDHGVPPGWDAVREPPVFRFGACSNLGRQDVKGGTRGCAGEPLAAWRGRAV